MFIQAGERERGEGFVFVLQPRTNGPARRVEILKPRVQKLKLFKKYNDTFHLDVKKNGRKEKERQK